MERGISAIVLAGGFATRMGRDKATLEFRGVSFAQHQVDKLRALGAHIEHLRDGEVVSSPAFLPNI